VLLPLCFLPQLLFLDQRDLEVAVPIFYIKPLLLALPEPVSSSVGTVTSGELAWASTHMYCTCMLSPVLLPLAKQCSLCG
jgi:hypothetical protein